MALRNELLLMLMERVDDSSDATAIRDVMAIWLALLGKFSPLIGPASVHVLFMRGLDINRPTFPWLPAFAPGSAGDQYFSAFEASLTMQPSGAVLGATRALLGTYIDSLFTLIGPTLTAKFVCAAVGDQRPKQ
jgi:hypothetical protein